MLNGNSGMLTHQTRVKQNNKKILYIFSLGMEPFFGDFLGFRMKKKDISYIHLDRLDMGFPFRPLVLL